MNFFPEQMFGFDRVNGTFQLCNFLDESKEERIKIPLIEDESWLYNSLSKINQHSIPFSRERNSEMRLPSLYSKGEKEENNWVILSLTFLLWFVLLFGDISENAFQMFLKICNSFSIHHISLLPAMSFSFHNAFAIYPLFIFTWVWGFCCFSMKKKLTRYSLWISVVTLLL